jgi:hypothetical protein
VEVAARHIHRSRLLVGVEVCSRRPVVVAEYTLPAVGAYIPLAVAEYTLPVEAVHSHPAAGAYILPVAVVEHIHLKAGAAEVHTLRQAAYSLRLAWLAGRRLAAFRRHL